MLHLSFTEDWTGALNYYRNLPFYRLEDSNLRETEVRCLLVTGKLDDSVPLESVVKSTEFIQKYYLKIIENAGHYPHQENPAMVNKALLEFLLGMLHVHHFDCICRDFGEVSWN